MRAQFRDVLLNAGDPVGSVQVDVFDVGTTSAIADTIFAGPSAGTTLANPFTSDADGTVLFYLNSPRFVDLRFTKTGYPTKTATVLVGADPNEVNGAAGTDVAFGSHIDGDAGFRFRQLIDGRRLFGDGTGATVINTVASATNITLPAGDVVIVSGSTTISTITVTANDTGRRVTLIFSGTLTVNDGTLGLAGNFSATPNDTLTLVCDGVSWYEAGRSVN